MKDFSIELAAEQIIDTRTKEYFSEVLSSFINNHFRSSLVMLWAVVIADLVYKLQSLRDLYQDATAISILESIELKQKNAPTNPEWEPYLLDEISTRTQFFEAGEYQHIKNLHQIRHLSAHPVISSANLLFQPNKETTRAAIRNALECVLLKPPVYSKKVVLTLIEDLAVRRDALPDEPSLRLYLEAKYFKNLHTTVKLELIKTLWKFCFRITNSDADANRQINHRALVILFNRDKLEFLDFVRKDSALFSEVAPSGAPLNALIAFLAKCKGTYQALTNAAKIPIKAHIKTNINFHIVSSFVNDGLNAHLQDLNQLPEIELVGLSDSSWQFFLTECREEKLEQEAFNIAIKIYCNSSNFSTADSNFARFIAPLIQEFDKLRITQLLNGIEKNNQTYWRGMAKTDHKSIKLRIDAIGEFDISKYTNFIDSLPTV